MGFSVEHSVRNLAITIHTKDFNPLSGDTLWCTLLWSVTLSDARNFSCQGKDAAQWLSSPTKTKTIKQ